MAERFKRRESGFTVLEALISLALFVGLLAGVMAVYAPSRTIYRRGERKADVQQHARLAMAELTRLIRMAGYFPENYTDPPPATLLDDPVLVATDQALAIHGDADGSGASNAFLFCLDGNVLRRGRAAQTDAGAYTCSNGDVLADNVIDLTFTYYDAAGDPIPDPPATPYQLDGEDIGGGVPDLSDTTLRGSVRRVVVTVTAEVEAPGRGPQTYALTSEVWVRNSG